MQYGGQVKAETRQVEIVICVAIFEVMQKEGSPEREKEREKQEIWENGVKCGRPAECACGERK
jgi:hypothetical protein